MTTDAVAAGYNGAGIDENAEACRTRERLLRRLRTGPSIAFRDHRRAQERKSPLLGNHLSLSELSV